MLLLKDMRLIHLLWLLHQQCLLVAYLSFICGHAGVGLHEKADVLHVFIGVPELIGQHGEDGIYAESTQLVRENETDHQLVDVVPKDLDV